MKYTILLICFIAYLNRASANLSCIKCGASNGLCLNDDEGSPYDCGPGSETCIHGFLSMENGTRVMMKDCLVTADYTGRMVGCLRVKNSDQDDHVCFCDSNNCNKDYCDPSHCDCPYADPDTCFDPVDPSAALQCYECEGGPCKNGDTGTLKTCDHGEKSCLYGKVKLSSATNTTNLVIKGCDRDSHVAKTGCVDSHSDHYFQDGQGVNIKKV